MSKWTIEYYDKSLQDWIKGLPISIRADFSKLTELLQEFGVLRLPHSRAMGDGLFELRPKGKRELLESSIAC